MFGSNSQLPMSSSMSLIYLRLHCSLHIMSSMTTLIYAHEGVSDVLHDTQSNSPSHLMMTSQSPMISTNIQYVFKVLQDVFQDSSLFNFSILVLQDFKYALPQDCFNKVSSTILKYSNSFKKFFSQVSNILQPIIPHH